MPGSATNDPKALWPKRAIDPTLWQGSFNGKESTIHQLSPYIGKIKTGMANALIELFSLPGDIVLDPFSGSGVVPFEASINNRIAWANDLNPYAYVLTRGKLECPSSLEVAIEDANNLLDNVESAAKNVDLRKVPKWVRKFFHKETLRETIAAFQLAKQANSYFLLSCLLGILHHQRPGFLSYPASHLVPYLRDKKFPKDEFPELYEYRDLGTRLIAKVKRSYRNAKLPGDWGSTSRGMVTITNSKSLELETESVDSVISSPPYYGALSYARDNRLRLWFLGHEDWKIVDSELSSKAGNYVDEMASCIQEIFRVLRKDKYCVLVLGDVQRNGKTKDTAKVISSLASEVTGGGFQIKGIYNDRIPDIRRSRRGTRTTKIERILVMYKSI